MNTAIKHNYINLIPMNLHLFDVNMNVQTTNTSALSPEMKTFYDNNLIDFAKPNLVYDQFAQKRPIPKSRGIAIEFRGYNPLPAVPKNMLLTDGVTPNGQSMTPFTKTATVGQYGGYIAISDMLQMTAIDNNIVEAGELLGDQSGRVSDTITRDEVMKGTNVQYADGQVAARYLLVGGDATPSNNHYATVNVIKRAVRNLKNNNAKKINGKWVGVIHPDITYDLQSDSSWIEASKYAGSTQLFDGEVGEIFGVRFVESTQAKIFHADNLSVANRNLTVNGTSSTTTVINISQTLTSADQTALVGRKILLNTGSVNEVGTITSATASAITLSSPLSAAPTTAGVTIYPGEAGAKGRDVYGTLIVGANAYGTTEITGGGLQNITKQLGSAGSSDPLDQRATIGWKLTKTAKILTETFMVRVETASTSESGAN